MGSSAGSWSIIGDIYDAAVDPDDWQRLPQILAQAGEGSSAVVSVFHPKGHVEAVTYGLPDEALQRYLAYYHWVNPLHPIASARGAMTVSRSSDIIPDLQFRQTEFYTDFARGFDTALIMGTPIIPIDRTFIGEIGIHRGSGSRGFDRRIVNRVQRLLPHVQRALQLRARIGAMQSGQAGFAALDTFAIGCIICDDSGRVIFANAAAEALEASRSGIVLGTAQDGIVALKPQETRQLRVLIAEAAAGGSGGAMSLTDDHDARLFALVAPLPPRFGMNPRHVLVTLRAAGSGAVTDVVTLQRLFGLTPAEGGLALGLLSGQSLSTIGEERGVSQNTLRTQLSRVLVKTNSANQRELVRTLGLLPPLQRQPLPQRK